MLSSTQNLFRAAAIAIALVAVSAESATAQPFDHSRFDGMLKRYVSNGLVDYDSFRNDTSFPAYLTSLASADPASLNRDEQLAFWINAYNAYTIQLINKHKERKSIRNINKKFGFSGKGPWTEPLARVNGTNYTLDDIEHKIIRPVFAEPRIHFALVCAALGCPPLREEAFTGEKLEAQLREQGMNFILRSPGKNRVDVANRTFHHSSIFEWYKDDFGGSIQAVGRYLSLWFPPGSAERALLMSGDFKAVETEYDWALNSHGRAGR